MVVSTLSELGDKAGNGRLAISARLAQIPQLKGTGSVPAVSQKNCLSMSSWEGKLANREAENVYSSSQWLYNGLKNREK